MDFQEKILDEGGGPAQIYVVNENNRNLILVSNYDTGEIVLYDLKDL
jgi:hypothetical protein